MKKRVVLGFSGGVDSSTAAALLTEDGYEVLCLYLETGSGEEAAARASAKALGLPLRVCDARADMEKYVCAPFAAAYCRGETPSPCVMCNPSVKLRLLLECADELGAERIATGHYARAEGGALYMGREPNDQSYMLCRILPEQLRRLVLPLGGYEKGEVRALAASLGLPSAKKGDSMELCFVPDGDFAAWIERRGGAPCPGPLIYNGRVVGEHRGIHRYTLGQRRGLGFAAGRRVFVSKIDPETNSVTLSDGEGLFTRSVEAFGARYLAEELPPSPFRCLARIRHSRSAAPALCSVSEGGRLSLLFDSEQRAPTPGQAAAVYLPSGQLAAGAIIGHGA